ncbi:hypothetical protein C2857_001305 [Epichloe festucae Fl1]|uniref:Uncharacterized protein n=1 Tax=Epichloe festucae (strain Fl1) TaxID=877507 RepID=A0A7S9KN80_EPIFF|nr:hypothetical protein C2857_001305 [Epichloe festucae Fl1]
MDVVTPRTPLDHDQQTPSTPPLLSSPPPPPPQFDSAFSAPTNIYFHNTIDPSTASLTTRVLGPNLAITFTHSRAPSLFPAATILTGLTKKTTGFLALVPPGSGTRTVLAWAESGHGHGPEGDLLDANAAQPSVLPNALWARRVIRLSSLMGISLGHPFDRLTRGGRPGMFRASHVEVKLATHAIYTLLSMFRIGGPVTAEALARLRRRTTGQASASRPRFEIYFSKRNCRACAAYVSRLCELTGVDMTLCWKDRLVEMEYKVARMGEARPLAQQGVVTVEDDDDDDDDVRLVNMVDLTGDDAEEMTTITTTTAQPLGTFLDGLAYCVGQGSTDRVARAVVGLARIRRRQRRSSLAHHHHHYHRQGTPHVRETGDAQQDWLATPPPSSSRRRGRW